MHMVVAVLRPAQLEAVRQALAAVHVTRLTVCDAHGYTVCDSKGYGETDAGSVLVQESVMEIAVNDDFLERTVETIRRAMRLGEDPVADQTGGNIHDAAAKIFVLPMHEAVQIYREVRGPEAI